MLWLKPPLFAQPQKFLYNQVLYKSRLGYFMARLVQQHPSARSVYEVGVESIEEARKNQVRESSEAQYGSSFLGKLLTDLTVVRHTMREQAHYEQGAIGEYKVAHAFLEHLSNEWVLFTPFVIFPRPGDYAQLDHLLLGPPGIFIVETKAWQGSYIGNRDAWKRRAGNQWVACDSPTHQLSRHLYWLQQWLERHPHPTLPANVASLTEAYVLFTEAKWVKANTCAFGIFENINEAITTLSGDTRRRLTGEQITQLVAQMTAPPLPLHKSAVRPEPTPSANPDIPQCPLCKVPMVKRTAKKGDNKGESFWGCSRYPNCRQIINIKAAP